MPSYSFSSWYCTRARHRRSTCTLCVDACPTKAISWAAPLQIAANKCTGCGVCAAVCPSGAFEAVSQLDSLPPADPQEKAVITIGCTRATAAGKNAPHAQVACLAQIDEAHLLAVNLSCGQTVSLEAGACQSCPSAGSQVVIEHIAVRADSLRRAFGLAGHIDIGRQAQSLPAPVAASGAAGVSRRGLFSLLAGRGGQTSTAADVAGRGVVLMSSDTMPKMQLPVRLPARRQRLIEAMNRLTPDPASLSAAGAATGLWVQFGVTKDCDGCAMCAYFCPTGALQKIERDGRIGLAFRLAHCTNCRLCQDVCVRGAVALSTDIDLRKALSGDVDIVWLSRPALPTPMAFAAQVRTSNSALQ